MDIEMFGRLLSEPANAPDSANTCGFAGPVTGMLPLLPSGQLIRWKGQIVVSLRLSLAIVSKGISAISSSRCLARGYVDFSRKNAGAQAGRSGLRWPIYGIVGSLRGTGPGLPRGGNGVSP
jgi:hypothetical protein